MGRPLANLRIVTMATNLPGPLAAARLAALGADIVKVEPPEGDALATVEPAWYQELASGQDIRIIDLKTERGHAEFLLLLADADLLLTSSRPAALARLGLSWRELSARFPRLCQVAIVGHAGPEAERPGHDLTYQAAVGLVDGPVMPRSPYADLTGAERAATEACAALLSRQLGGRPSYREVSLAAAAAYLAEPLRRGLTVPGGPLGGGIPGYGVYRTREGHIALACLEPHFLRRLTESLAVDGSRARLERAFLTRTAAEWEEWAMARDIPLTRVAADPQAVVKGFEK